MADQPFDLRALELEAENAPPFEFVHVDDETYTMPVSAAMPWQDQLSLETKTQIESLEVILGPEQFARFVKTRMSSARLEALLEEWQRFQGLTPGE